MLLVDDEPVSRKVYEDMLAEHGFQVFPASSGAEGLALAGQHPIETAILDIVMPAMSGLEVLEQLHRAHPDLPVIMLTGHATSQNAIAALKLGAFNFLVKGPDNALIVAAVQRAIRHRRETRQAREKVESLRARITELEGNHLK